MRLCILGCGGSAGVPMLGGEDGHGIWGVCDPREPRNRRTRSSILLTAHGRSLLVDTGPDLREQLLREGETNIEAVLYTHAHADHIAGLDELRSINRITHKPVALYGTSETLDEIEKRFDYAFQPWNGQNVFFRPVVTRSDIIPFEEVEIAGFKLMPFRQIHGRCESIGFRCGEVAYSTDTNEIEEPGLRILQGVDTWVVDCFQRAPHPAHAWLERVLQWREQLGVRRTVLTHMGADMDWGWLAANLPAGVEAAYDGMHISS